MKFVHSHLYAFHLMLFTGSGRTKSVAGRKKQKTTSTDEVQDALDGLQRRKFPASSKSLPKRPKTASQLSEPEFVAKRAVDYYVIDRMDQTPSVRGNNPYFHNSFQEECYREILLKKPKDNTVIQHHINVEFMRSKPNYFGEALEICEEFDLFHIMELEQDYDEEIVAQFLATVHMGNETTRRIKWMTKEKVFEATWEDIAESLNYQEFGPFPPEEFDETHFRVHFQGGSAFGVEKLAPLYNPDSADKWKYGDSKGLYPTWDIMHRIYRETINPKVGNFDEIHGYLKNLMVLTMQMKGQGKKLDVMDFIWHELWHVISKKKNISFAPLIMRIVVWKWLEHNDIDDLGDTEKWAPHKSKRLLIKPHKLKPRKEVVDEAGPSNASKGGSFAWMARAMKKIYQVSKKVERHKYDVHEEKMKARQVEVARRRAEGEDVPSGSEQHIPTWDEWQAKNDEGEIIAWSSPEHDGASSSHPDWDPWGV